MQPEEYLRSKGFKLRNAPGEWQTLCPFCGDKARHGGHLYVNREHGAFMCHRCQESGSFFTLQTKLGDTPEPAQRVLASKSFVWKDLVEICQDTLIEQPEVLAYLREERGLTGKTIGKYRIGYAPKDLIDQLRGTWDIPDIRNAGLLSEKDYPLFWDRIMIPYYQRAQVVTVRGKQVGGNVLGPRDTSIHLFGADNLRGHKEVFICEGEFDTMYLDQLGYAACGLPGAGSFQDHWKPWFEAATRVFVVLDADDAGRKGTYRIQQALGKKVRPIELPVPRHEKSTDITEYFLRDFHTKDDFEALVREARGSRLYDYRAMLRERDDLYEQDGIKLGWVDLDFAIHPGLLPGQVVTVLAKTGAGKTAFLTQVLHNLSSWQPYDQSTTGPGLPVMVLSLEQTKAEIGERLERVGRIYNPWATEEQMATWHSSLRVNDENRVPPTDIRPLLDEFTEDVGMAPRVLIVDYLGYWARSFTSKSKYEQVSDAVMELKHLAKQHDLVIIAPHQVSRAGGRGQRLEMDFARDSGVVEETSDFVFALRRPFDVDDDEDLGVERTWRERADVRMELLKSRHGNVGKEVMMLWAPYSLALIPRGSELERRVQREWALQNLQSTYEETLLAHQGKVGRGVR